MPQNRIPTEPRTATIAKLSETPRLQSLDPIAARFIYSLRLIAVHQRAGRDPVPELATRLASVGVAAKALALSQTLAAVWPENLHVSRFCCCKLTHDEATIGAAVQAAGARDRPAFERSVYGLLRPERTERLWGDVLGLVEAELRAC